MSHIRNGIFYALAVVTTFGAVQLASGHDLTGRRQLAATAPESGVNRAAKADRAVIRAAPGPTETIAFRHDGVDGTSVLVRIPVVKEQARNLPPAPAPAKPGRAKTTVACEPPVSVLTEVAKLLQPGRCLT